ncbi:MAG: hypothetical protein FWD80_07035 [Propionibacteriaceae bacterium]|nr:hypothetical protein [Propionibacteriaceae bacterium]
MSQSPPETGNPTIDAALTYVAEAGDLDVVEQAQRLSEAQTVLHDVLRTSRQAAQVAPRSA